MNPEYLFITEHLRVLLSTTDHSRVRDLIGEEQKTGTDENGTAQLTSAKYQHVPNLDAFRKAETRACGVAEVGAEVRRSRNLDVVAGLLVHLHFQSPYQLHFALTVRRHLQ
jgi:hypothetical protein